MTTKKPKKPKAEKLTAKQAEPPPLGSRTKVTTRMSVVAAERASKAARAMGITMNSFVGIAAVLLTERFERFLEDDPDALSKLGLAELLGLAGVRDPR